MDIPYFDAEAVHRLRPRDAVAAIEAALGAGFDPADDPPRWIVPAGGGGQLLVMPSDHYDTAFGVKLATVQPRNAYLGLPRVHGVYVLFDWATLAPMAILDGAALTSVRTPATSVAAVRPALMGRGPLRVAVFGSGPQAVGHVTTLADTFELERAEYLVRTPRELANSVQIGSAEAHAALAAADVVVCATSAREPLFDSSVLRDDAVVIAIGSHEPDAREVDSALCARATVVVEDAATAQRESGEVVQAIAEGVLDPQALVPMWSAVLGPALPTDRPLLFVGSGMAWQDLAVAQAVVDGQ